MKKSKTPVELWFEKESKKIKVSPNVKDSTELSPAAKIKMEKARETLAKAGLPK